VEKFNVETIFNGAIKVAEKLIVENATTTNGAVEALKLLQKNGVLMAICSNSNVYEIHSILTKLNLWQFFEDDLIFGREMVLRGKPSGDIYLLALEKLNVAPNDAIALEDSTNGAKASIEAGIKTVIFTGATGFCGMKAFDDVFERRLPNFDSVHNFAEEVIKQL
jgi:HAD superfamily hydrolase (TIGR01509 family)